MKTSNRPQPSAFDFDQWRRGFLAKARIASALGRAAPTEEDLKLLERARHVQERMDDIARALGDARLRLRRDHEETLRPLLEERRRWLGRLPAFWYFNFIEAAPNFFTTPDPFLISVAEDSLRTDDERAREGLEPLNADATSGLLRMARLAIDSEERLVSDQQLFAQFVEDIRCEVLQRAQHRSEQGASLRGRLPAWADSTIMAQDEQEDERSGLDAEFNDDDSDVVRITVRFRPSAPKLRWLESNPDAPSHFGGAEASMPVGLVLRGVGSDAGVTDGFPSTALEEPDAYVIEALPFSRRELFVEVRRSELAHSFQSDAHARQSRRLSIRGSAVDWEVESKLARARYFDESFLQMFVSQARFAQMNDVQQHQLRDKLHQLVDSACHAGGNNPLTRYANHAEMGRERRLRAPSSAELRI